MTDHLHIFYPGYFKGSAIHCVLSKPWEQSWNEGKSIKEISQNQRWHKLLQRSHIGIWNLHKDIHTLRKLKKEKWRSFPKTMKRQKHKRILGAGSHIMVAGISSSIHAIMNVIKLQIPFKSKSWLETRASLWYPCGKNILVLHFSQVYLATRNFSWAVNRQRDPNLYYYPGWTPSED